MFTPQKIASVFTLSSLALGLSCIIGLSACNNTQTVQAEEQAPVVVAGDINTGYQKPGAQVRIASPNFFVPVQVGDTIEIPVIVQVSNNVDQLDLNIRTLKGLELLSPVSVRYENVGAGTDLNLQVTVIAWEEGQQDVVIDAKTQQGQQQQSRVLGFRVPVGNTKAQKPQQDGEQGTVGGQAAIIRTLD